MKPGSRAKLRQMGPDEAAEMSGMLHWVLPPHLCVSVPLRELRFVGDSDFYDKPVWEYRCKGCRATSVLERPLTAEEMRLHRCLSCYQVRRIERRRELEGAGVIQLKEE